MPPEGIPLRRSPGRSKPVNGSFSKFPAGDPSQIEDPGRGEPWGGRIQRGDQGFGQIAMGGWGGVSHHNMQHGGAGNLLVVEE
jgi:hypothetical protein